MKTRRVFKAFNVKNLKFKTTEGLEIEFPDVKDNGTPKVGDKVIVNGEEGKTGTCVLPNGIAVFWENGEVTEVKSNAEIKEAEKESKMKAHSKQRRVLKKPKGKKMIGIPVAKKKEAQVQKVKNEILNKKKKSEMLALLKNHKMKFMKKLE